MNRLSLDPVPYIHRPYAFYIMVMIINIMTRMVLIYQGFEFYESNEIKQNFKLKYWFK
jgi:hypothetical protein